MTGAGRDDPVVQSVFDTGASLEAMVRAVRDTVPVYGSGGFTTYDEPAARTQLEHCRGGL